MILSLWFWSRKSGGRRSLVSISGVVSLLLLLPFIWLAIWSIVRSLL